MRSESLASDPLCLCEGRKCVCTKEQRAYLETAIEDGEKGGKGHPDGARGMRGVTLHAQRATCDPVPDQDAPPFSLSLDGRERTYYAPQGWVEKFERKCNHCGEFFRLYAQPTEDKRLFCDLGCYRWADL